MIFFYSFSDLQSFMGIKIKNIKCLDKLSKNEKYVISSNYNYSTWIIHFTLRNKLRVFIRHS